MACRRSPASCTARSAAPSPAPGACSFFRFTRHPPLPALFVLSALICANFPADHRGYDGRVLLAAAAVVPSGRTTILFRIRDAHRRMPPLPGFVLVALFIWFGENLGTASHAWIYPSQARGWSVVAPAKPGSRFLLMLISYTMVAAVPWRPSPPRTGVQDRRSRPESS